MIALLQRVIEASVTLAPGPASGQWEEIARIGPGLAVLVGVERADGEAQAQRILERVLGYRVFDDERGRMNHSLVDTGGGLLLVPQFTLPADTAKGTRPSFSPAAAPESGRRLFEHLLGLARARHPAVAAGRFGAHMRLALVNDGPATFVLRAAGGAS